MRSRSLTATLMLAFAFTTLTVFILVGCFEYFTLEQQIYAQDDQDIVLAARHERRLTKELDGNDGVRLHADRLISLVLGNQALSLWVEDRNGQILLAHNIEPISAAKGPLPRGTPVASTERITDAAIRHWTTAGGVSVRAVATQAELHTGDPVTVWVAYDTSASRRLLEHHRNMMFIIVATGVLVALLLSYLLIRTALRPLRDIAGHTGRVTVDRLGTRIALANTPWELEVLVMSLNAMLARLDTSFARLSRFTADLAHDMRTPISNMRGASEVALARERSKEEYQALLASNLEECDRLSRMIENVIFLSRAENPLFAKQMARFSVPDELAHIAEYFEGLAEEAGVAISITGTGDLSADIALFQRAVSNLLSNALRHTPPGGELSLSVEDRATALLVVVANQGSPIEPAHLDKIFDRFYRVDPSRSTHSGSTGLGLAIVRSIMELHGGTVHAESDQSGTRFVLAFPRT
jgi:two-component system heavy metal sensor histidine kinase CusS